ncbi:hypothetical protein [Halospeciosus flavus]|uniref:PrgI family protein n=1 Tax=Halospeciosus flavus TaxID=3032283 RepID=A0ABD5Z6P2_9EURY|nr:hypothetical protein [Halospeciosus flavus]
MQTHDPDPSKRIPKSLGTEATLIGNYTLADAAVALLPAVIVILAIQLIVPADLVVAGYSMQDLALPVVATAAGCGLLFVYMTPSYTSSLDWLLTMVGFYRADRSHDHDAAKQYTRIKRLHPRHGAIERTDGTMIGLVRVDPPSMALATDEEWHRKATDFRTFLDTVVAFPIQLYATTQTFPVDDYLSHYERRLDDPDVKANPRLTRLIEEYRTWYATELDARQMTIRDHYVIVPVSLDDVRFERNHSVQLLARLPVLGLFVDLLFAPDPREERVTLCETLDQRLRQVEVGLRDIDGCNATRIAAPEAAGIIAEYWAGKTLDYGDLDATFRTRPLVDGRSA